jgi:phytoene desaturase
VTKALVVGAGPGGLSTAIALAGLGVEVTLLEAKSRVGGRMGVVGDGTYTLDTGPTILQLPQVIESIVASAGKRLSDYVELRRVEPNTRLHFWDGTSLETSADPARMEQALAAFGSDPARMRAWMAEHGEKYRVAWEKFIAYPARSVPDYFNPFRLLPAARFRPWESLATHFEKAFDDERLTYAFSYPSKYLGLHPTNCSSVFSVIPYLELAFGVWHPMGGFRALADGLARCLSDLGGTVRTSTPVRQILVEDGRATGVVLESGERLDADVVVVNADFARANLDLLAPEHRPSYSDRKIEKLSYSCSSFMVYLGLDRRLDLNHHEIYLSRHVTETTRDRLEDRTLDEDDPPFYVAHPSATDPSFAPEGHSALYILVPVPNTGHAVDWAAVQERYADEAVERLRLVGAPDVAKHVRFRKVFTAETWRDDFRVHRGAVFNLAHGWRQLGPLRPRAISSDVDGLMWVGGGTHPGSGLVTIFESARICARHVADRFGLSPSPHLTRALPAEPPRVDAPSAQAA